MTNDQSALQLLPHVQPFIQTFILRRRVSHARRQLARWEQLGLGVLLRDTSRDTSTLGVAGNRTSNLPITRQPALPPVPLPPTISIYDIAIVCIWAYLIADCVHCNILFVLGFGTGSCFHPVSLFLANVVYRWHFVFVKASLSVMCNVVSPLCMEVIQVSLYCHVFSCSGCLLLHCAKASRIAFTRR